MSKNVATEYAFICCNITWDTDEEDIGLPREMAVSLNLTRDEVNDPETVEELLSDFLSDSTGWCHCGFRWEAVDFWDEAQVERYNSLKG